MEKKKDFINGLKKAWRDEMLSAQDYRALANQEKNSAKKDILIRMAEAEERHAETWAKRLRELDVHVGIFSETFPEKMRRLILLKSDAEVAAKMLEADELQADKLYDNLLNNAQSDTDKSSILEAQKEEHAHSKVLEEFGNTTTSHLPQNRLEKILGREKWHVHAGGWIGQAIYGVNDGLGAAFGVVSGVAGATSANSEFILLSGFAATIASALSMGSGAYLATKSEREVYEAEIEKERREISENPQEEIEEMELFYQLKGFSEEEARIMTKKLAEQPDHLLTTLAHEELGLSEKSFPNQWKAATSATISTAIGASVPVIPFIFFTGIEGLLISLIVSTLAHFLVGASKVIVTGRSWLKGGTEMTLVGLGEAAITYVIGILIAPTLG
ncbi:MAG: VIT1/CCC1 transporter family protein [Ignavibacteriales bacterium]|nr:VIT1/CCC1 transporter family protein [Ignavibacteriales bacterium]